MVACDRLAIRAQLPHLVVVIGEGDIIRCDVERHALVALSLVASDDVLVHVDVRDPSTSSAFDVLRQSWHARVRVASALAIHDFGLVVCVQVMLDVLGVGSRLARDWGMTLNFFIIQPIHGKLFLMGRVLPDGHHLRKILSVVVDRQVNLVLAALGVLVLASQLLLLIQKFGPIVGFLVVILRVHLGSLCVHMSHLVVHILGLANRHLRLTALPHFARNSLVLLVLAAMICRVIVLVVGL